MEAHKEYIAMKHNISFGFNRWHQMS